MLDSAGHRGRSKDVNTAAVLEQSAAPHDYIQSARTNLAMNTRTLTAESIDGARRSAHFQLA